MNSNPKHLAKAALLAALTSASLAFTASPAHAAVGACRDAANPGQLTTHSGLFSGGVSIPDALLAGARRPQGLAYWNNWDGSGVDLLVATAYDPNGASLLIGVNPITGAATTPVFLPPTHAGGVAVVGNWIYVSGPSGMVNQYSAGTVRGAMKRPSSAPLTLRPTTSYFVYSSSFLGSFNGVLFAGKFNETRSDWMVGYSVDQSTGALRSIGSYAVPRKTQGVGITRDHFVFSTSYGRDNRSDIYVVRRGYTSWSGAVGACMRAPNMSEGVALGNGRAFVIYESASSSYLGSQGTRRIQMASLAQLTGLGW